MYTLFIVFSGVISFPKLCVPLENKDEYKSLTRSVAELMYKRHKQDMENEVLATEPVKLPTHIGVSIIQ